MRARATLAGGLLCVMAVGCTSHQAAPAPSSPTASSPSSSPAASPTTSVKPTATATSTPPPDIPPPPEPSTPAPSTAGSLSLVSLPVPAGWKAIAAKGGADEGFIGNGTPAHARDPRYAAYGVLSVGCADVRESTYTRPVSALEVNLAQGAQTGVAEALKFPSAKAAATFFALYQAQLRACVGKQPISVQPGTSTASTWTGRRQYSSTEQYAEVARLSGSLVRVYLLLDPRKAVTTAQQAALLKRLG